MRFCEELLEERACFDWGKMMARELGSIDAIEAFIVDMTEYACLNKYASKMFSAAQNGAENVLDELVMKGVLP